MFFFFKQKTAYEMRISDWSSDVCASDLRPSLTEPERTRIGRAARIRSTAGNFRIRAASGRASRRQQAGSRAMIDISESAQTHFRKLIEREAVPGMGVRLAARDPGTARADVRLE